MVAIFKSLIKRKGWTVTKSDFRDVGPSLKHPEFVFTRGDQCVEMKLEITVKK